MVGLTLIINSIIIPSLIRVFHHWQTRIQADESPSQPTLAGDFHQGNNLDHGGEMYIAADPGSQYMDELQNIAASDNDSDHGGEMDIADPGSQYMDELQNIA